MRRRGGRPCPPAGIVHFYGNPMRIRSILEGRCGHRPLHPTTKIQRILRADRVVRPYKRDTIDRLHHRFSYVKCWPCRDSSGAGNRPVLQMLNGFVLHRRGRCLHRPIPPPKRECPRVGADDPTTGRDESQRVSFSPVGVDAHIDPPKAPILWRFSGESVLISHPTP